MGSQSESGQRFIQGNALKCPVCRGETFRTRQALLNRRWTEFLDLSWIDRHATCEVCTGCGHVLWFLPPKP